MNVSEGILSGLFSIRSHKMRSALTLVGIVVGVAAVVTMTSFVGGISKRVLEDIGRLGFDNVFFVSNMRAFNPEGFARLRVSKGLSLEDAEVLRREVPEIRYICPTVARELVVRAGSEARHVDVFGATPDGFSILKLELGAGRYFGWQDVDTNASVCVLGELVKDKLFGDANPVGEEILLGSEEFLVVGVLRMKEMNPMMGGDTGQEENHERIYIPVTTAIHYVTGSKAIAYFAVRLRDGSDIAASYDRIHEILLREHRQVEDFQIENVAQQIAEVLQGVEQVTRTWNMILGSVATVSLLVGGIGLLSVLMISVNERLREIGIRKAVGAEDRAIFQEFLIESVTISAAGGLAGVGLGAGLCKLITLGAAMAGQVFEIPVSGFGVALGLLFSVAVGLVFGVYPAWIASRLDPIAAISRYA